MLIYILAAIICIGGLVNLFEENKSQGKRSYKDRALLSSALVIIVSLLLVVATTSEQQNGDAQRARMQAEQAAMQKEHAIELGKVRHRLEEERLRAEHVQEQQRQRAEAAAKAQEEQAKAQAIQLSKAEDLERAQNNVIKLQRAQNESSKKLTESQKRELQLLDRVILNDNLSGVEISFKPSEEHWAKIAQAYRGITSPQKDVSYSSVVMMAERNEGHWKIRFADTKIVGGRIQLPAVSTSETDYKAFEQVINEAVMGLAIIWGNNTISIIEPFTKDIDDLPSAIKVSRDEIALVLRHPRMIWNLNELKANPKITLRGRNYPVKMPSALTIRSLDPGVTLNQRIDLNWQLGYREDGPFLEQLLPYYSGPHELDYRFNHFPLEHAIITVP
jgi:hypothetical protein